MSDWEFKFFQTLVVAPDGVQPPVLVSDTSTSVSATWQAVGRVNADEDAAYILQFREHRDNAIIQESVYLHVNIQNIYAST